MASSPQDSTRATEKRSTLIEFPGVSRNSMPEWRKELSERVREVQEKRAREAAREAAEAERQRMEAAINPAQLELLPPAPMPAMNPLVAAALKRIERAHQTAPSESRQPRTTLATAVAYAPEREDNDMSDTVPSAPELAFEPEVPEVEPVVTVEKTHHLAVVAVSEPVAPPVVEPPRAAPKRLIRDDNDPALNYLDSISKTLCVDDLNHSSASAFRRIVCALLDLIFCALLSSPIAGAMYLTGSNLRDPQVIGVLAGSVIVVTFLYLTSLTALTGRTWAMRLLSLRVIDTKTGLIPTGGQSIGRSFFYLLSLATVVGILFALVSREGYTVHDRFTRTAVVTS
ncbi:MAG TPA: RDD family protein [Pyrinomonadaceae bacterium]|nr:RDD family protein [Pyrinomonadaceae bacterium]